MLVPTGRSSLLCDNSHLSVPKKTASCLRFPRFILNHESLTEEFCYMNRSGPYELLPEICFCQLWATVAVLLRFEIVPFSKINPNDYMTISIRGVTHYSNGELDYQDSQPR